MTLAPPSVCAANGQSPAKDPQRKVSSGIVAVAMIINGLGFTNRRLYLTPQFFESKPVERLLGPEFEAKDFTDYTLGHALDDIADYGASKLFAEVAFGVALDNNLIDSKNHLDTTSFLVHGAYEVNDDPQIIEVSHGFSKAHRPDLKQVVLSLVVNGPSSIPLWMDPLDGNSSDKTSFHETIKRVEEFRRQIDMEKKFKWVADSALYTKDQLLKDNGYTWVTRVPETIFKSLWAWAKRRHPNKCLQWIKDKYFTRINQRDWIFFSHREGKPKDKPPLTLKFASSTCIKRHVKIKTDANPYDPNFKSYFQERKLKQKMSTYSRATHK